MNPAVASTCVNPSGEQDQRDRAVIWMNRGHRHMTQGQSSSLALALVAYAEAAALLRPLSLAEHPSWANSLGAALMNYGHLMHRVHGRHRAGVALQVFAEAIAVLEAVPAEREPWARANLAGTHINRANLLLDFGRAEEAQHDAVVARELVRDRERADLVWAEIGLKARRAWCDAIGQMLPMVERNRQGTLADEAGDVVDEALTLVRHWQRPDADMFADLELRFFRFGAELCRRHQPHFLAEFVEENLAASPTLQEELRAAARDILDAALADGGEPGIHVLDDERSARALAARADIAAARRRLESNPSDE